ncbi:unnamed protein product [Cochlearia groenlandica]
MGSLWTMLPNLKFSSKTYHSRFSETVTSCLLSNKSPVIDSLHLQVRDKSETLKFGLCIGIAFAFSNCVHKFVLESHYEDDKALMFPSFVCRYNSTLENLELKYAIILDFPSRVCLKSLRKLELCAVKFKDEESVCNLLGGCPVLEDLVVNRRSNCNVETCTIAVPSLQRLTILHYNFGEGEGSYVINAPRLKYLNIDVFNYIEFYLIENVPELVEAKVKYISGITNDDILQSLASAKLLSLNMIFSQTCRYDKDWEWNNPKCVPECLLFHLETFFWITVNKKTRKKLLRISSRTQDG